MEDNKPNPQDTSETVEPTSTEIEQGSTSTEASESLDATVNKNTETTDDTQRFIPKKGIGQRVQKTVSGINIYMLLFILVLFIVAFIGFASYSSNKKAENQSVINGQELSQQDLENLASSDQQVGDAQQTLTIASNAVFNGRVLVRNDLDVAGTIRVGGALSLPGITVSGTSAFENVQVANNLSIAGNSAVQGTLTVQQNLSVGGSASFAGQISAPSLSVERLILNQDLQINRHIDAGGPTPVASRGSAVGGAGTVSVSGTDTAGTVSINFGPGSAAGIIASINFANNFSQTPHVVITPVGSSCANLNYYVNRTTGGFSIGTTNAGGPGTSCAFDYVAID
ncbi:polymer-forming cytoskeletal protein [Candidatus Saccharibacteria bacterium]|nr:polymer-forming cytoskeletal protein [Candidatus Saccharibacteria bacterium]HPD98748.1 polymer-forming cytoskeletal protein [Candidatus Saccharibacteria bacterium]